ncbi:5218_t:CDS:2 [Funneliformis geosporum]|nr:5218_t:CDS:2 [Funneliformis geosporum]
MRKIKIENDMIIKRGEVYKFRVSRKETEGTEQQKNRPAVIISTNRLNKKNIRFVAVPITSKKLEKVYDFEVPVMVANRQGKALCDQIRVYNETRLIKKEGKLGILNEKELKEIGEKMIACLSQKGGGGKSTIARYAPARISKESLEIAKQANLIIQPVRPSLDDLNPAIREFNGLFKAGISKSKLNFLINAVGSPAMEKNTREYLSPAGYFIFPVALEEKVSYQEAQNQGLSIGEVKYKRLQEQQKAIVEAIYKGKTKDEKNVNLVLLHFSKKKESKSNFYIPEKNCPYFQLQIGELYKLEITRNIHDPQKSVAPINEVSENTQSLNIDKRSLRKTGRTHLFATRVKKE